MASFIAVLGLLGWLYLAFFRGSFWRPLLAQPSPAPMHWPSVDIIVPARDEAEVLPGSLPSLFAQDYPGAWRIIFVDDHSSDGTASLAQRLAKTKGVSNRLTVITADELQAGWNGKLNALNTGVVHSKADYILFTDADIFHTPDSLRELVARAVENRLDLTSQMVRLHCGNFAEKLLIPAFVFFFAMLYPFRLANDPASRIAAAAGGVILISRRALNSIGGLKSIKTALIDDCALAKAIKDNNGRIELTMSPETRSLRIYPDIADIRAMISRTAFYQLNYSKAWLAVTIIGMAISFLGPTFISALSDSLFAARTATLAWLLMIGLYMPTIRFYRMPLIWAVMLPAAAVFYMLATIDSARFYWQGKSGQWKGRVRG